MYLLSWHKLYTHNPTLNEKYQTRLLSSFLNVILSRGTWSNNKKRNRYLLFETIIVYFKESEILYKKEVKGNTRIVQRSILVSHVHLEMPEQIVLPCWIPPGIERHLKMWTKEKASMVQRGKQHHCIISLATKPWNKRVIKLKR